MKLFLEKQESNGNDDVQIQVYVQRICTSKVEAFFFLQVQEFLCTCKVSSCKIGRSSENSDCMCNFEVHMLSARVARANNIMNLEGYDACASDILYVQVYQTLLVRRKFARAGKQRILQGTESCTSKKQAFFGSSVSQKFQA